MTKYSAKKSVGKVLAKEAAKLNRVRTNEALKTFYTDTVKPQLKAAEPQAYLTDMIAVLDSQTFAKNLQFAYDVILAGESLRVVA